MARDLGSIVKMSRREGYALHPKAHKALVRRATPPGQQGQSSRPQRSNQYTQQLREKQKVKRLYGLLERQFSNLMNEADRRQGSSGENLLQMLECRADNVIYRAGFAVSRRAARQLVTHGHFLLNDKRVDIPSIQLKAGDLMKFRDHSVKGQYFKNLDDVSPAPASVPAWIKVNRKKGEVKMESLPTRDDAEPDINEQLIVEYYSR